MKKILIITIYLSLLLTAGRLGNVSADAKARELGFDIVESIYGEAVTWDEEMAWVYYDDKVVGYGEFKTAVYKDLTNSNYGLVIYQTIAEPRPTKIDFFNTFNSQTSYVSAFSDVDGAYRYFGYGYYASSSGFDMIQPQPVDELSSSIYSVGIQYNGSFSVEASMEYEINELNISNYHSYADDEFSVKYNYSCKNWTYSDCSYRESSHTEQIGLFLINWEDSPPTTYKAFINKIKFTIQFADGSGNPATIFWALNPQSAYRYTETLF